MLTLPDVVAFTVPARLKLLAVRVIKPPLVAIRPVELNEKTPKPVWFAVLPVIVTLPEPVDEIFEAP